MPIPITNFAKKTATDEWETKANTSTSEVVVVKLTDSSSPQLFDADEFFIADGTSNITDGTSNTVSAHTGGVNVAFCDGSVRLLDTTFGDYQLI